ncbi:hypothetical protein SAMN05216490_4369 [Mucilaginibacter mallensis]|uniref:Uncharacterized protein n=1 Tax=Mucilaginibacter mallensis TaxID=652787 RepID=A0A1H2BVY6_MUCMA|nr:hypothetical protein SAMN05216490_4369 [Mucilaginibacter mallensis]
MLYYKYIQALKHCSEDIQLSLNMTKTELAIKHIKNSPFRGLGAWGLGFLQTAAFWFAVL